MSYPPFDVYQEKLDKYYEYGEAKIGWKSLRYFHRQRLDTIFDLIVNSKGVEIDSLVVFDAGCGRGANLIKYAKYGAKVIGLDISEKELIKATEWVNEEFVKDKVVIIRGDVLTPPLKDESFDVIICSDMLEHAGDIYKGASSLARLLKKDGIAIITVPNAFSLFWVIWVSIKLFLKLMNLLRTKKSDGEKFKRYFFWDIKSFLTKAGFKHCTVCSVYMLPLLHFGAYNRLEEKVRFRFPFKYMGANLIVKALK